METLNPLSGFCSWWKEVMNAITVIQTSGTDHFISLESPNSRRDYFSANCRKATISGNVDDATCGLITSGDKSPPKSVCMI